MLISLAVILVLMSLVYLASLHLRDASIIDRFWGFGFVAVATLGYVIGEGGSRALLMLILVAVWGLRLSAYITWRNWGEGEDRRYARMRERRGRSFWWSSYFLVFLLQGILLWFISLPIQAVMTASPSSFPTFLDGVGAGIVLVGILVESLADYQMARFRTVVTPGQILDKGLWRYSRHPNYFGDALTWWGFFLMSCATSWGVYTLFSPILMTWLLRRVSGVPLLEADLKKRRPGYAEYTRRTSPFVPWPPAKG